MKVITICGSIMFFNTMEQIKRKLELDGFKVAIPEKEGTEIDYNELSREESADLKQCFIDKHLKKIKSSDAILIANYSKNGTKHYIGANSFLEMAFAYLLKKPIYILNSIPEQHNSLEIEGLKPIVLNGNLSSLKILIDKS